MSFAGRVNELFNRVKALELGSIGQAALSLTGNLKFWTGQSGGWRDLFGVPMTPNAGLGIPTWEQLGSSPFYGFKFNVGDQLWFPYHLQHDYSLGTDIFLHAHWLADGTDAANVKWEFTYVFAKGFGQAAFDIPGGGSVATAEESTGGTAWKHMTSEIAAGIANANFEPDGILLVCVKRVTNGGVDNADGVFLIVADLHYQADSVATKHRTPDFYAP